MSRIPRQARRDVAEPAIVQALQAYGFSVQRLSAAGCPDLAIGKHGITRLAEVKSGNQPLRPSQAGWWLRWQGGALLVIRDVEEVDIVAAHWRTSDAPLCEALFRHRVRVIGSRARQAETAP
jgi:hypothetical protein